MCLTALARDIHRAYPGQYKILASGNYVSAWDNNPHCAAHRGEAGQTLALEYLDGIREAGRGAKIHFLSWLHKDFEKKTGVVVPVTEPRGDLHLSAAEDRRLYPFRYWVVVAGGKRDMTAKIWPAGRWQRVVDLLAAHGIRCVQAGADFTQHFHPRLRGVEQAIGKTDSIRDLFRLIAQSDGVLCGITGAMHVAACFNRPCVVIAGGREEPWWEHYSNRGSTFGPSCGSVRVEHKFLHTIGLLDCCMERGCWKMRTVPLEQTDYHDAKKRTLCVLPVHTGFQPAPKCLDIITPDMAVDAVTEYYQDGILPPPNDVLVAS